jgi:hypothetical protein
LETIQELLDFKNENNSAQLSEPEAEYAVKDDFDKRFARGIPHEEIKRRTFEHTRSLPWKQ